jgi:hypothetical protein
VSISPINDIAYASVLGAHRQTQQRLELAQNRLTALLSKRIGQKQTGATATDAEIGKLRRQTQTLARLIERHTAGVSSAIALFGSVLLGAQESDNQRPTLDSLLSLSASLRHARYPFAAKAAGRVRGNGVSFLA